MQIADFTFLTLEKERAKVQTSLNLRDGEKVVVGTATIRNRALVIVLTAALYARFRSRKEHTFAEKILSAMRAGFGGHREPKQTAANAKPKV